ncbi:MAG: LysO family transporter [Bacteroidota bacterium]|nr:LysO family transporter [Bacteroidota bacterium]
MLIVISIMFAGFLVGFLLRKKDKVSKYVDVLINSAIILLLFFLGVSVGINEKIINNFEQLGFEALMLTVGAVIGSLVVTPFIYKFILPKNEK